MFISPQKFNSILNNNVTFSRKDGSFFRMNSFPVKNIISQDVVSFSAKNKAQNDKIPVINIMRDLLPKRPSLTQDELDAILREMGTDYLSTKYKTNYTPWTKEIPTTGYCYTVTEFAHYFVDSNTKACVISYDDDTTHWFLVKPNGDKIDFSLPQFKGEDPMYEKAKCSGFCTDFPSKRACEIAVRLGIITRETATKIPQFVQQLRSANNKQDQLDIINAFKSFLAQEASKT